MSKKPRKIEEAAGRYAIKKSTEKSSAPNLATPEAKRADKATFSKIAEKIFRERKQLLHKLAQ
jgi:hypothetical protein